MLLAEQSQYLGLSGVNLRVPFQARKHLKKILKFNCGISFPRRSHRRSAICV